MLGVIYKRQGTTHCNNWQPQHDVTIAEADVMISFFFFCDFDLERSPIQTLLYGNLHKLQS